MISETKFFIDYIGKSRYGIFLDDPSNPTPSFKKASVEECMSWIARKYGKDSHVELSTCADLIFRISNGIDLDLDLSGDNDDEDD